MSINPFIYFIGNEWKNRLRFVKIYFNTPTIDVVTKDRAAKFSSVLSSVGGTLGLFTGLSIFGGIEIVYYVLKIILHCIKHISKN